MEEKRPAVYILASQRNGTLYIGVTSNLGNLCKTPRGADSSGLEVAAALIFLPIAPTIGCKIRLAAPPIRTFGIHDGFCRGSLVKRIWEHRNHVVDGFTARHDVSMLVYHELHACMESGIHREKLLKKWKRDWKLRLIEERNPQWRDLWGEICRQVRFRISRSSMIG